MIAAALVLAVVAYLAGAERVWRRAGRGRAVRGRHVALWLSGLVVVAAALQSPLEQLAEEVLSAHMVQHLLLILPAPVLLTGARPGLPLARLMGAGWRRRLHPWRIAPLPLLGLAWTAHVAVVVGWHVPGLYAAALAQPAVHVLEHVTMLGTAVVLWGVLLRRDPRGRHSGMAALAAATTGLVTGAVGVVLVFSPAVVYPTYAATAPAHGLSAIDDQAIAGMVMWSAGGLAYVAATCLLVARWLQAMQRLADREVRRRLPGGAGWVLVLVLTVGLGACTIRGAPVPTAAALRQADQGRELILDVGCVTCHDIPGVPAPGGRVGPSLAGFANRQTIAGSLPNNPESLVTWLVDPQAIQPGNVMPDLGLSVEQATAIAAYLATLD